MIFHKVSFSPSSLFFPGLSPSLAFSLALFWPQVRAFFISRVDPRRWKTNCMLFRAPTTGQKVYDVKAVDAPRLDFRFFFIFFVRGGTLKRVHASPHSSRWFNILLRCHRKEETERKSLFGGRVRRQLHGEWLASPRCFVFAN